MTIFCKPPYFQVIETWSYCYFLNSSASLCHISTFRQIGNAWWRQDDLPWTSAGCFGVLSVYGWARIPQFKSLDLTTLHHWHSLHLNVTLRSGYECEPFNNPPDFFLDVMQGDYEPEKSRTGKQLPRSTIDCSHLIMVEMRNSIIQFTDTALAPWRLLAFRVIDQASTCRWSNGRRSCWRVPSEYRRHCGRHIVQGQKGIQGETINPWQTE